MDAKRTLIVGAGLLVVGILWAVLAWGSVLTVLAGIIALVLLLAAALFLVMGFVQVREDRSRIEREQAEAQQRAAMAAHE